MRVVHVSTSDLAGGAARLTYRIHRALIEAGVDSRLIVSQKLSDDPTVSEAFPLRGSTTRRMLRERLDALPLRFYPRRRTSEFSPSWLANATHRAITAARPDVVHLHWVNHGFLPIAHLPRLGPALVWSLMDQWAFTGGCHYSGDCRGYEQQCGNCPLLGSQKAHDLSARTWRAKRKAWQGLRIHLMLQSEMGVQQVQASSLFGGLPTTVLPPPVDTRVFRPIPMGEARRLLGVDETAFVVAFGATQLANPRKGFDLASAALRSWGETPGAPRTVLCTFGEKSAALPERLGNVEVRHLGRLHDDLSLALVLASADAALVPSREDAGPLLSVEALACGTPVIGFPVGATADLVQHQFAGFLARPFEAASLAEGLSWAAAQRGRAAVRDAARDVAVRRADTRALAPKFLEVYAQARSAASP